MASLNVKLHPKQLEIFNDPHRFKVVAAGRRFGKSRLAAWLLLSKRACSVDAAIAMVAAHQPQLVLGRTHRAMLADFHQALPELP